MTPYIVPHLWFNEIVTRSKMGCHLSPEENARLEARAKEIAAEHARIIEECERAAEHGGEE